MQPTPLIRTLGRLAAVAGILIGLLQLHGAGTAAADGVSLNVAASFESVNVGGHYIRHRFSLGEISRVSSDLDRADATWIVRPALSGTAGAVSFESVNYPDHFLRHENYRIKLSRRQDGDLFRKDASFHQRSALNGTPGAVGFESVNFPGHYIRHQNFELWLANKDAGNRALFPSDVSFRPKGDLRKERDIRVNDSVLRLATAESFGKAQIRLDRDLSFVRIPGIYDTTFTLPTRLVSNLVKDAHYYVHDLNSREVTTKIARRGVETCIDFETDDTELIGYVKTFFDDMWDDGAPDADANPFTVCVWMPLAFDAAQQSIRFQGFSLDVQVHATWRYHGAGGLAQQLAGALVPDINAGIERAFESMLLDERVQGRLTRELSEGVRRVAGSARITGIDFDGDTLLIQVAD